MADWNAIKEFLGKVVPWPVNNTGHVNLHYSMENARDPKGKLIKGMGWPFQTADAFINRAAWVNTRSNFKDVWFCTSRQRVSETNSKGKPKAARLHVNAMDLKAIWVDIDVKPDDGTGAHYTTFADAWQAICQFRNDVGLPQFSAAVNSGSGLHVYWISAVPLTPVEWLPFASGLKAMLIQKGIKCDAGLTTDDVRLLRVPGTFNHKYDPPREVELLPLPIAEYDFETQLAVLSTVSPAPVVSNNTQVPLLFDPRNFNVAPILVAVNGDELSTGIEKREFPLLDPRPIFRKSKDGGCDFLRDAFATGGKDYGNPLWNLSVLCTIFMENGHVYAHEISKGHPTYTEADTQALYDRKVADRAERGIGYPSCATIQSNGCKACATCPLFKKRKSPLNITGPVTATVNPTPAQAAATTSLMLPPGFDTNEDGIICKIMEKGGVDDDEGSRVLLPLFSCVIDSPLSQKNPDGIYFRAEYDKGNFTMAFIPWAKIGGQTMWETFAQQKVRIVPSNMGHLRDFYMAWLTVLHRAAAAQQTLPYGWYYEVGAVKGFAYGGQLYKDDGTVGLAGTGTGAIANVYRANGQLQSWFDAWQFIKAQQRPDLELLTAIAFASPLMMMCGKSGGMVSVYGESGTGKTYAMELGLAVWAAIDKGKDSTSTTKNSMMNKLGQLQNLPVYWDEITDDRLMGEVLGSLMEATNGIEKGKMIDGQRQQEKGSWQSMMCISSNRSFVDYVIKIQKTHTGGFNRVLEFFVAKSPPHMLASSTDADIAKNHLRHNYGMLGAIYAKFLADNHSSLAQEVHTCALKVEQDLSIDLEERFWSSVVATIICGAEFANRSCNVGFDVPGITAFLYSTIQESRIKRTSELAPASAPNKAEDLLTQFLRDKTENTIWTDSTPQKGGRHITTVLHEPNVSRDVRNGIQVRWDVASRTLRFSRSNFYSWLRHPAQNYDAQEITTGLQNVFGMTKERRVLAAGTRHMLLQEQVFCITVTGTSLEAVCDYYQVLEPGAGMAPAPADVGTNTEEEAA